MTAEEILTKAKDLIPNNRHWTRRRMVRPTAWGHDKYCSLGAVRAASNQLQGSYSTEGAMLEHQAVALLQDAFQELYGRPDRMVTIISVNDNTKYKLPDIHAAFDKAIAKAGEKGL